MKEGPTEGKKRAKCPICGMDLEWRELLMNDYACCMPVVMR